MSELPVTPSCTFFSMSSSTVVSWSVSVPAGRAGSEVGSAGVCTGGVTTVGVEDVSGVCVCAPQAASASTSTSVSVSAARRFALRGNHTFIWEHSFRCALMISTRAPAVKNMHAPS